MQLNSLLVPVIWPAGRKVVDLKEYEKGQVA